jgi:hypothetical protein
MAGTKIYYSVYTLNEKIWIKADTSEIVDGCLAFYDIEEVTNAKVLIAAFPADYWRYMYEADVESGESIQAQIPFWKRHNNKHDVAMHHDSRPEREPFVPRKTYTPR